MEELRDSFWDYSSLLIWNVLGMAVGFGMYPVAIFATLLALLMFTGMWYAENRFKHWFTEAHVTRDALLGSEPPKPG